MADQSWMPDFDDWSRSCGQCGKTALPSSVSSNRKPLAPWEDKSQPSKEGPYDPGAQGNGYARYALFRYATFLLELRRFLARHGGMWMLSDADTEVRLADAVYEISWHAPLNEEEDSWLRRQLADSRHEEQDHFVHLLSTVIPGPRIMAEWIIWVQDCTCADIERGDEDENGNCICPVHSTMRACQTYCDIVDADWLKIADWYRLGTTPNADTKPADSTSTSSNDKRSNRPVCRYMAASCQTRRLASSVTDMPTMTDGR